jgi:hypothetical protein
MYYERQEQYNTLEQKVSDNINNDAARNKKLPDAQTKATEALAQVSDINSKLISELDKFNKSWPLLSNRSLIRGYLKIIYPQLARFRASSLIDCCNYGPRQGHRAADRITAGLDLPYIGFVY